MLKKNEKKIRYYMLKLKVVWKLFCIAEAGLSKVNKEIFLLLDAF